MKIGYAKNTNKKKSQPKKTDKNINRDRVAMYDLTNNVNGINSVKINIECNKQ